MSAGLQRAVNPNGVYVPPPRPISARRRRRSADMLWSKYECRMDEVRRLFREDKTVSEVAEILGTRPQHLRFLCHAYDVPLPPAGPYFSVEYRNAPPIPKSLRDIPGMLPVKRPKVKPQKPARTFGVMAPINHEGRVRVADIKAAICERFELSEADLIGKRRDAIRAHPRQLAMVLIRELTDASYPAIGKMLGGRDHSTIIIGVRAVRRRIKLNPDWADHYAALMKHLTRLTP